MANEIRPGNVWHVENSNNWANIISRILLGDGHTVITTRSATEAKKMIPKQIKRFDVSILDEDLGDGKGEQIATLLRKSGYQIGVIGLSKRATPWADVSLNKGDFDIDQLRSAVGSFTAKK